MDEPLSNLDLKLRQQMRFEIRRIQKRLNITTLFVTHDQTEALQMSDRIIVVNRGQVEQIGIPSQLYDQPRSRFVAEFIGDTNILQGAITAVSSNKCRFLTSGGLSIDVPNSFGLHEVEVT